MVLESAKRRCALLLFSFVFCVIVLAAGCGSSTPVSVIISPPQAAIGTGQTLQFTASATTGSVSWTASAGTIDSTGDYTAPSGTPSMTVTVTATSMKDSTKSASATVNVVAPGQVARHGECAGGELYHFPSHCGERFRAVWYRYQLRPDNLDATGTDRRRTGEFVRRGNEGQHAVPHEGSGAVRRWDAIHGPGPDVHHRGVPGSARCR